jgi:hypothetical protein
MKIEFLTAARTEFREIVAYYNGQRDGLGLEFASELKQTLLRMKHYPLAWSPLSPQVRRCRVNRFPYSVIYAVGNDLLIIAAIQHHSKAPDSWRKRLNS